MRSWGVSAPVEWTPHYRGRDTRLEREVAIKVPPAHLSENPDALARFEREAKAVAALSHPNILSIHDFDSAGGVRYAVTELLQGETLRERLDSPDSEGGLPLKRVLDLSIQVADGIAAAHEKRIVHRDLKPENLFVTREGRLKILDFGLSRQAGSSILSGELDSPTVSRLAAVLRPPPARGSGPRHRASSMPTARASSERRGPRFTRPISATDFSWP